MRMRVSFCSRTIVALIGMAAIVNVSQLLGAEPVAEAPPGFSIEMVAGPPMVERPIVAAFDDDGRSM